MPSLESDPVRPHGIPLVSVCITAYNSAAWLPRAISSALKQCTDFSFEIVIGDDRSSDNTPEVLQEYQAQYPDIIRVLQRAEKLGMQRNYFDVFEHCRGKYIAWLDADDYWTSPEKLGLQVAALEADPSVSACGHFVRHVTSTGEVLRERCPARQSGRYGVAEVIAENFIPSPSIVFRNGVHRHLPESFFALTGLVDWPILLQSALLGDVVLLDGIHADYVLTPGSAYMSKGPLYQDTIDLEFYDEMRNMLPVTWRRAIRAAQGKRYEALARVLAKQGNRIQARENAWKAFCLPCPIDNVFSKTKVLVSVAVGSWLNRSL